jgi:hypothetical protein
VISEKFAQLSALAHRVLSKIRRSLLYRLQSLQRDRLQVRYSVVKVASEVVRSIKGVALSGML